MYCVCSSPVGESISETDKEARDGSAAAVGSAMGMLTSLTSVVQSTVSRNVLCVLFVFFKRRKEKFTFLSASQTSSF